MAWKIFLSIPDSAAFWNVMDPVVRRAGRPALAFLIGTIACTQPLRAEVTDTIRQLTCEQICLPIFSSQIGKPVMWGIPRERWGSQEYNTLASHIEECRTTHIQAGRRAESSQCNLATYVRDVFAAPKKDAEERDRKALAIKELEQKNRAVQERDESVRKSEADAAEARATAKRVEELEQEQKTVKAEREARAEQRVQEAAATDKADREATDRIERARRDRAESEAREQATNARLRAAENAKVEAVAKKVAAADADLRNFINRNPTLLQNPPEVVTRLLLEFYTTRVGIEFCQQSSSAFNTGNFGDYGSQLTEINRRTKLMEDVAIKILDIPLDLQKMTGPDGVSLKNTRLVDQLQARKTVIMKECNEGLARLSFIFDFNH